MGEDERKISVKNVRQDVLVLPFFHLFFKCPEQSEMHVVGHDLLNLASCNRSVVLKPPLDE